MSDSHDVLTVTIEPDFSRFLAELARAFDLLAPAIWRISLARQRDRSRLVTRRKQRRRW